MDINKFCIDFLKKNHNSETEHIIQRFKNKDDVRTKCKIIDTSVSWNRSIEGFFYFYFLQLRFGILLTKYLIRYNNIVCARDCYNITRGIVDYCSGYDSSKNGSIAISPKRYKAIRHHYERTLGKLYDTINKKSS